MASNLVKVEFSGELAKGWENLFYINRFQTFLIPSVFLDEEGNRTFRKITELTIDLSKMEENWIQRGKVLIVIKNPVHLSEKQDICLDLPQEALQTYLKGKEVVKKAKVLTTSCVNGADAAARPCRKRKRNVVRVEKPEDPSVSQR